jgi:Cys-rich repeat protein
MKCPQDARICAFGRCAECTADDQCPNGRACDKGKCAVPFCCGDGFGRCPDNLNCNIFTNTCSSLIVESFCSVDAQCPAGWLCDGKQCFKPPTRCMEDSQCSVAEQCNQELQVCVPLSASAATQGSCSGQPGAGNDSTCGPAVVPDPDGPVCLNSEGTIIPLRMMRIDRPCESGCRVGHVDRGHGTTRAAPIGLLVLCLFALLTRRSRTIRNPLSQR